MRQIRQTMRVVLLAVCALWLTATTATAQTDKTVTLSLEQVSVKKFFDEVSKQTGINFIYGSEVARQSPKVTVKAANTPVRSVLNEVMEKLNCTYTIEGKIVTVTHRQDGERTVSGYVRDNQGEPLMGVPVCIGETRVCTVTDENGFYTFKIPTGQTVLKFSFVGMDTEYVTIAKGEGNVTRNIVLQSDNVLQEVMVTGYQTIEKGRSTGSFSILNKDDLKDIYSTSITKRLEGLVAGLNVSTDGSMEIRGVSSLNAVTKPLIVVDGYPMESSVLNLNPNDIEQVTVLKDAASASIWGIRAANGVIVITTKRGSATRRPEISYSGTVSLTGSPNLQDLHLLNSKEYASAMFDRYMAVGYTTSGVSGGYNEIAEQYLKVKNGQLSEAEARANVTAIGAFDNRSQLNDLFYRSQLVTQHNVGIRTGSDRSSTFVSMNYDYTRASQVGNDNNKWNVLVNNDFAINRRLNLQVNLRGTYQKGHDNAESVLGYMPWQRVLNDDGTYYNEYTEQVSNDYKAACEALGMKDWSYNILKMQRDNDKTTESLNATAALRLGWKPVKGLELASQVSYELGRLKTEDFYSEDHYYTRNLVNTFAQTTIGDDGYPTEFLGSRIPQTGGIKDDQRTDMHSYVLRNTAQYGEHFGDWGVKALIGSEVYHLKSNYESNRLWGYNGDMLTVQSLDLATLQGGVKGFNGRSQSLRYAPYITETLERYVSYFGTAAVSWQDRYDLFASLRQDKTNLLTNASKYRNNPAWSVGGKWAVDKEQFFQTSAVDYLSLRASFGLSGNIDKSTSPDIVVMSGNDSYLRSMNILIVTNPSNPQLGWEKTYTLNLGLDFSLWKGRLSGSMDFYNKTSKDLLASVQSLDPTTGWSSFYKNSASMYNRGLDLSLHGTLWRASHKEWTVGLNFSYNFNKVTELLYTPTTTGLLNGAYYQGRAASELYVIRYGGLDTEGHPTFMKADGDEKYSYRQLSELTIDDLKDAGRTTPPFYGSLQTQLKWNDFTFGALFTYKLGHKMRLPYTTSNTLYTEWYGTQYRYVEGQDNTGKWVPKMYTESAVASSDYENCLHYSDQLVSDGGVIRLRSLSMEYNISPFLRLMGMRSGSIRLSGENLWAWYANRYGLDPDQVSWYGNMGLKNKASFIASLNINF